MQMPGRTATPDNYRFGYNGMEKDPEMKGDGNSYTTEFRQYDPRLGRWASLDPLMMMFPNQSPYCAFDNNPVFYIDPYGLSATNGDEGDKPKDTSTSPSVKTDKSPKVKEPGFWRRMGYVVMGEQHVARARMYAARNGLRESAIIEVDNNTIIVKEKLISSYGTVDENGGIVCIGFSFNVYSVFRESKEQKGFHPIGALCSENDDMVLTIEELMKTQILSGEIMDAPDPVSGTVKGGLALAKAGGSGFSLVVKSLKAFDFTQSKKLIRLGVGGHEDVLKKGFHVHIEGYKFELGMRPGAGGTIGFVKVGKKSAGTALDLVQATETFSKALANAEFKEMVLLRLKITQESLNKKYLLTKNAKLASDRALEINFIIKAIEKNY